MKLLYITNQICGAGGLERVLSIKTNYFIDVLGYEIHIITLNQENTPLFYEFSKKIVFHDLKVKGNPIIYLKKYIKGLKSKVAQIQPEIISVCDDGLKGFFVPLILKRKYPTVYERHASKDIFKKNDKLGIFEKIKLNTIYKFMEVGGRFFDAFVVLTNDNLTEWKYKNLHVIPNPLSFLEENHALLVNKKVISVGNHSFQKGHDRLLKIWSLIHEKHKDWQLEIYGKIDDDKKNIKLAEQLGITDSVSFFNPVKNIQEKYLSASIYVMTSRSEGFGMVLIEAFANGLPCIAFDCPCGPKDIISNDKDGFLIPDNDFENYTNKLKELMVNEKLRLSMGKKAKEKSKMYLPNQIMPLWDTLFKNIIFNKK
ncbi:glycosyltransferase family 4 protein [Mariniflexile gromovii]|uniref:Glycosyltransferase family 4 protein n=1 Tax=Mariniflexile gromovii TaxID=362523 RepID=A0ABS4BR09_9FLAO|nr:glycosyltransferase family 4 protein [Mariniflexile gromovii]MBP0902471.1 glycosyltransferase family 4 protein [Mariniflexile gromovii]